MEQINNLTLNISNNLKSYFINKGDECEILAKKIYEDILKDTGINLFYYGLAIVSIFFLYLGIEIYKKYRIEKLQESSDFEKMINLDYHIENIKRVLVFLTFIIGARILQIAIWSL